MTDAAQVWADAAPAAAFAGLVAVGVTVAIERLGGRVGGLLGTLPTTIVPASLGIYAHELFAEYDTQAIIRVGTCGGLSEKVKVRDVILGVAASTDSAMNRPRFGDVTFAPAADFELMRIAADVAEERLLPMVAGGLFSSDQFYNPNSTIASTLARYGVLGVEMEAAALYTLAAQFSRRALAVCTVSDHLLTGEETSSQERQETFEDMIVMALETIVRLDGGAS